MIIYVLESFSLQKMKDAKSSDVFSSISYQFTRRCTLSEPILTRIADDLIARYSPKQHPHPDFFKQDAALAHNQITLYIDQYIQVMRKYPFLEKAATIISILSSACLRINDFLAKQLYHHMRAIKPQIEKMTSTTDNLCLSCGKLRQNQKLRILREELNIPRQNWQGTKIVRQVTARNGQKYDVEELIQEQLQNLDSLNEEEVRKKFIALQLDHDKRRQEMMTCLQELKRANDRVVSYSKTAEKQDKNRHSNFDIKDYVFKLSRHFYHNLSTLDLKIKNLKQNISPIAEQETQTEVPCILITDHNEIVENLKNQIQENKSVLNDTKILLTFEQRKSKQNDQIIVLLQEQLKEIEMQREEDKIAQSVTESQFNGLVIQKQLKINSLQNLINQLKTIIKNRHLNVTYIQEGEAVENEIKTQGVATQCPQPGQEPRVQDKAKWKLKKKVDKRISWKQAILLSPNAVISDSQYDLKSIDSKRQLEMLSSSRHKVQNIQEKSYQMNMKIVTVMNQTVLPFKERAKQLRLLRPQTKTIVNLDQQVSEAAEDAKSRSRAKRLRLTRIDTNKKALDNIVSTQNRKTVLILQGSKGRQDETEERGSYMNERSRRPREKNTLYEYLNSQNDYNNRKSSITNVIGLDKKLIQGLEVGFKRKKRRNFSQQNTIEVRQYFDIQSNIQKNICNQRKLFTELNMLLQTTTTDDNLPQPLERSPTLSSKNKKSSLQRKPIYSRSQHNTPKHVLTLQQINYSTYFYSVTASLRVKSVQSYFSLKKYLCLISGEKMNEEHCVKNALKVLLGWHRKCNNKGSVCKHMEALIQKVKTL